MSGVNKYFYLVGNNISTSLSPTLHNTLFKIKSKLGYEYRVYKYEGTLPTLQALNTHTNFGGLSITIPFKRAYY